MPDHTLEPFISSSDIQKAISTLSQKINIDYKNESVVLIGLLKGSVIFLSDLARALNLDVTLDFMLVSSYGEATTSSMDVRILKDLEEDIQGKHVLIVEDIIDTGYTLHKVVEMLQIRSPKSLKICTLLDKPERREVDIFVDYIGIKIPDQFVVGYGLDFNQKYRNLPDIRQVVFHNLGETK